MRYVSISGLRDFGSCPRKFHLSRNLKRIPVTDAETLRFGTLAHDATATLLMAGKAAARQVLLDNADMVEPVNAAKLAALLEHYSPPLKDYHVLDVERRFEVPVRNPRTNRGIPGWRYIGYVDAVMIGNDERELIVREFKTTSHEIVGFGPYWAGIAIDAQISLYALALNAKTIVYDVMRKPQLRVSAADRREAGEDASEQQVLAAYQHRMSQVIAEDPEQWYQWRVLHRTDEERLTAQESLYQRVKTLQDAYKHERWPMHPQSCRGIYGACPYLDVCCGRASLDDDGLFKDREER